MEKTYALFVLTFPNVGSWNGKWSGENNYYAVARRIKYRGKNLFPNLKEGNYSYRWDDGWRANVNVTFVTKNDAKKAERKSGCDFLGYEWMVDGIIAYGEIKII